MKFELIFTRQDGSTFTNTYTTEAEAIEAWNIADTQLDFYGATLCGFVDVVVSNPHVHG